MAEDRLTLLLEAERRGLAIDPADRDLLAEARRRGLIGGGAEPEAPMSPQELMARGITGSGFGTQTFGTPQTKVAPGAFVARVAPGVAVANPFASGALSAAGETVAQAAEQGVGAREGFDPLSISVAGATPPVVAGAARTVRGLGRTAVRLVPGLFAKAQAKALGAADDIAAQLTPETSAEQLFRSARGRAPAPTAPPARPPVAALPPIGGTSPTAFGATGRYVAGELTEREGASRTLEAAAAAARGETYREGAGMIVAKAPQGPSVAGRVMRAAAEEPAAAAARGVGKETVPAGRLTAIIDSLDQMVPTDPANAGLQQVRTFMGKLRAAVKGGVVDLDELMRQRLDLGREIARAGSAPELLALYGHGGAKAKGIIGALEEAVEAGGAGASAAREALTVFKRDLGVVKWRGLVESASLRRSISGVDTRELNIAKLGNFVEKNADELTAQLGPEGMALVRGYLTKFRSLPPTHAYNAANRLITVMAGGVLGVPAGMASGGLLGIPIGLGAALLPEIATNVFQVGRNPVWVNQLMAGLAQATRAGVTPLVAPSPTVRVGPEARALAGR